MTSKILSFDVGMINLAYCILEYNKSDIYNSINSYAIKCEDTNCNNIATVYQTLTYKNYCDIHITELYQIDSNLQLKCEFINNKNNKCIKKVKKYYKINNEIKGLCTTHINKLNIPIKIKKKNSKDLLNIKIKPKILDWGLIDITNIIVSKCDGFKKNKDKCNNEAKIYQQLTNKNYCNMHVEKIKIFNSNIKIKCEFINRNNKQCTKYVKNYFDINNKVKGYCNTHINKLNTPIKVINCNDIPIDIKKYNMIEKLKNIKDMLLVDEVIIENQPSYKNPSMKAIATTLYAYFLIKGKIEGTIKNINFVSPSSKTKKIIEKDNSEKYKLTKNQSITDCIELIKDDSFYSNFFKNNKKQDDLADSYLLAIQYLKNNV